MPAYAVPLRRRRAKDMQTGHNTIMFIIMADFSIRVNNHAKQCPFVFTFFHSRNFDIASKSRSIQPLSLDKKKQIIFLEKKSPWLY